MIRIENVSKKFRIPHERRTTVFERIMGSLNGGVRYEEFWALKDISLEAKQGEFIGIIGDNGSGKSTLLKIIGGILRPTTGKASVKGRISLLLELGLGFQPDMAARENVYLYGAMLGLTRRELDKKFDDIVGFAELGNFVDLKLKNYSSGMHMRLAFSTAIHADPDTFLIDEVLAVGDQDFQQKCFAVFRRFKESGKTIVFVSHSMSTVEEFCDRTLLLKKGECAALGETKSIINGYVNRHTVVM